MTVLLRVLGLALVAGAIASGTPAPAADGNLAQADPSLADLRDRYRRTAPPPVASANAWTAERHRLGETLFFDPGLSASGTVSCAMLSFFINRIGVSRSYPIWIVPSVPTISL